MQGCRLARPGRPVLCGFGPRLFAGSIARLPGRAAFAVFLCGPFALGFARFLAGGRIGRPPRLVSRLSAGRLTRILPGFRSALLRGLLPGRLAALAGTGFGTGLPLLARGWLAGLPLRLPLALSGLLARFPGPARFAGPGGLAFLLPVRRALLPFARRRAISRVARRIRRALGSALGRAGRAVRILPLLSRR